MRAVGMFGASVHLPKGFNEVFENGVKEGIYKKITKNFSGCEKTSYYDVVSGTLEGTVRRKPDGTIITKSSIEAGSSCYDGPAEHALALLGIKMNPKNEAQKKLQNKIFDTSCVTTKRLNRSMDKEVITPNGDSTQYFYHRGVIARNPNPRYGEVLESPYNISGEVKYLGGDIPYYCDWELRNVYLENADTEMRRTIKGPYKYTEWAAD